MRPTLVSWGPSPWPLGVLGELAVVDLDTDPALVLDGPWPCLGRAARDAATRAGNPAASPLRAQGEHPQGRYRIAVPRRIPETDAASRHSYGAAFVEVLPDEGLAEVARWQGKRSGIGIHAGDLDANGALRVTHGCLRVHAETLERVLAWISGEGVAGRVRTYEHRIGTRRAA